MAVLEKAHCHSMSSNATQQHDIKSIHIHSLKLHSLSLLSISSQRTLWRGVVFGLGAITSLIAIGTSADEYQTHYSRRFDSLLRV